MVGSKLVALCALFAGTALAQDVEYNKRVAVDQFWKRATSSFKAPEDTKAGSSCDAAFGVGYVTCREKTKTEIRLCYNPSIGQVCCQNSWGCPSDSYCLTEGLCCPSGADPATCAGAYSVALPSKLTTSDSGVPTTVKPPPPPPSTTWTSTIVTSTPVTTYNSTNPVEAAGYATAAPHVVTSNVYVVPVPLHTSCNSSSIGTASTGYISPPASTTSHIPVYTGAASKNNQAVAWTGFAAVLAVAGLL